MIINKLLISGLIAIVAAHTLELDDRMHYLWKEWTTSDEIKANSVWLPDYFVADEAIEIPGVDWNASGITYQPDTNSFFIIVNLPTQIIELNRQLEWVRTIELKGFEDTEAIAYAGDNRFVITDEREQTVVVAKITDETTELNKSEFPSITLGLGNVGDNKGFEGIAVKAQDNQVIVVRERSPKRAITISGLIDKTTQLNIKDAADIPVYRLNLDDLSGLHYNDGTGQLLLASDESRLLAALDMETGKVNYMDLERGFNGLNASIPQIEGVTMTSDGEIILVSEPNLIYRYTRYSAQRSVE